VKCEGKNDPMHPPRLQRLGWVFRDCPVYFLTSSTAGRRPILADDETHQAFAFFARNGAARRVLVGRYVLMPDHVHLFAAFGAGSPSLSAWMQALKRTLGKHWSSRGKEPPHWQKGFFDHLLRSEASYDQKWLYVRQNPVRAGLAANIEEWPYQREIHRLSVGA
jgi:REP-associated tyrosine transposase